jgi:two-component system cell cycle response regulator DivK
MSSILIVEDNPRNLKLVRDLLQAKGYGTLEAASAEEGLALARERAPRLILMDIQLPGMNGIEALRALRADPATARIPVIAITASVMQHNRREITAAGFEAFIEKPINVRGFLETVRVALQAEKP